MSTRLGTARYEEEGKMCVCVCACVCACACACVCVGAWVCVCVCVCVCALYKCMYICLSTGRYEEEGKYLNKRNTFDDFTAVAAALVDRR